MTVSAKRVRNGYDLYSDLTDTVSEKSESMCDSFLAVKNAKTRFCEAAPRHTNQEERPVRAVCIVDHVHLRGGRLICFTFGQMPMWKERLSRLCVIYENADGTEGADV